MNATGKNNNKEVGFLVRSFWFLDHTPARLWESYGDQT